ncbi:MAG: tRNA pseudouridine(55) synthase TruB [bacterium]|nr:tRNA pseudouridine(55) synthase TruB [bacterium]
MNGIIPVNKPEGITSYDVIRFIKRTFRLRDKIGHAGTLDPLASGILIICVGKATKMSTKFMNMEKEYEAKLLLGVITDTDDINGKVIKENEVNVDEKEIKNIIKSFEGEIEQIPPIVSAIKKEGTPFYKLHRRGISLSPPVRKVFIKKIDIINISLPYVKFRVICSKGTYIRALCRDIGNKLGCGGTQTGLKRIRVGDFKIEDTVTLEELEKNGLERYIITV